MLSHKSESKLNEGEIDWADGTKIAAKLFYENQEIGDRESQSESAKVSASSLVSTLKQDKQWRVAEGELPYH